MRRKARLYIIYKDNIQYKDITKYEFFDILKNASRNEILNLLNKDEFWNSVIPYEDSFEYLKKLNDEYELYIVTSTSYKTPREKFDRLFSLFDFLTEDQLIITSKKYLLNVDIMVDDCIDCLLKGNYIKFLINEPYNQEVFDDTIIRVDNLKDVTNKRHHIHELAKEKCDQLILKHKNELASLKFPVLFGIRPEDVLISLAKVSGYIPVEVKLVELLGSEYYIHILLEGQKFTLKSSANQDIKIGDKVFINFNYEKVHLFDQETTKAIY